MDGEPHGRRIGLGPVDAMADVRGNLEPVAGPELEALVAVLEAQQGGAGEQHDELVVGLVVPEAGGARLAGRDDALDARAVRLDQRIELLLLVRARQRREQVAAADQSLKPGGGSQGVVPILPGTETSRISMASEVRISLWRR